ncbi:MAG TPA: glycosyltransferase [Opitutaceae bacterium]|nr:glycosyltransferase [Opitutaceae bacterium]
MTTAPAISVVVAGSGAGTKSLPETLASIRSQKAVATELIVVDDGANGERRAWLADRRDALTLVEAPSAGTRFEEWNAGLAAARAEWILLLGTDDRLVGDMALSELLNWAARTEAGVVSGEVAYDNGRIERMRSRVNPVAGNFLPTSGALYRRSLFAENGGFDPAFVTMADYDFHARLWKNRVRFKPIPLRVVAAGGSGLRERMTWRGGREEIAVRHRYFSPWRCGAWDLRSLLRAAHL